MNAKKAMAAVLAATMCAGMSSVAFAKNNAADYTDTKGVDDVVLTFEMENPDLEADDLKASISWKDGKAYFDSVDIDDTSDGKIEVTVSFKDYYGNEDLDIDFDLVLKKGSTNKYWKSVEVEGPANGGFKKAEKDGKTGNEGTVYKTANITGTFGWGWINSDGETDDADLEVNDNAAIFDDDDVTFATFTWDTLDELEYAVKMSKQDAVNMYVDTKATDEIKAIMKKYEDADISVVNFKGRPDFDFTGTLTYYVEDEDTEYFFYEVKDGKPVKTAAKYDDEDACFTLKTRALGTYIISDTEMDAADFASDGDDKTDTDDKENPETGSVDFVNAAVALGAVSLVAAAAVALKK